MNIFIAVILIIAGTSGEPIKRELVQFESHYDFPKTPRQVYFSMPNTWTDYRVLDNYVTNYCDAGIV